MSQKLLAKQRCEACHADAPQLTQAEKEQALTMLDGWTIAQVDQIDQLTKSYQFKNFKKSMGFATEVALLAEENGHHPQLVIEWGLVKVSWWSHKIKGLHRNDAICAAKTDALLGM